MFLFSLLACGPDAPTEPLNPHPMTADQPVVVYSGRSESLVGDLFKMIEKDLGFPIQVQYGKTAEMATRLITEGDQSPADVVFAQDSGHLGVLAARGVLATLPDELVSSVDPRFVDPKKTWVGTSGRLRVMVYDTKTVPVDQLPKSLSELADPKWKGKLGWAPSNSSLHAHVSHLRHVWGEEKTRAWLEGVKANEPRVYPKNSPQVKAANVGEIHIGWVNHYYLHRVAKDGRRAAVASFADGDVGNVLMVAGAGVRKGSPRSERALKVLEALVSPKSQGWFAMQTYEYPTRPGMPLHQDVTPLRPDLLATVDQTHLADLAPTRTLLQDLGLQ